MNCYICGETIKPAETGVIVQPHEGLRHPYCDPQTSPVEYSGDVPHEDDVYRAMRVNRLAREAAAKAKG